MSAALWFPLLSNFVLMAVILAFALVETVCGLWQIEVTFSIPAQNDLIDKIQGPVASVIWWACAVYWSEASGVSSFFARCLRLFGFFILLGINFPLLSGELPRSLAKQRATAAMEQQRHVEAAATWQFMLQRSGRFEVSTRAMESAVREAILAQDPQLVQDLLTAYDDSASGLVLPLRLDGLGDSQTGDSQTGSTEVERVDFEPVTGRVDLGTSWPAFLSAVRALRPQMAESELRQRLRVLAWNAAARDLANAPSLDDLMVAATLFDARLAAVPAADVGRALQVNVPLLFRLPESTNWRLLYGRAPAANAVLWLDYTLWHDDDDSLDEAAAYRLLVGEEDFASAAQKAFGRTTEVAAGSWLNQVMEREGKVFFALVDDQSSADFALPIEPWLTRQWVRIALSHRASEKVQRLLPELSDDQYRLEIETLRALKDASKALDPMSELTSQQRQLLTAEGMTSSSDWYLRKLESKLKPLVSVRCSLASLIWQERIGRAPADKALLRAGVGWSLEEQRFEDASNYALAYARSTHWSLTAMNDVTSTLASAPGISQSAPARRTLEIFLQRLAGRSEGTFMQAPKGNPSYCAARAALAKDAKSSVGWWRRASEMEPKNVAYLERLAEALDAARDAVAASAMRQRADSVRGIEECDKLSLAVEAEQTSPEELAHES